MRVKEVGVEMQTRMLALLGQLSRMAAENTISLEAMAMLEGIVDGNASMSLSVDMLKYFAEKIISEIRELPPSVTSTTDETTNWKVDVVNAVLNDGANPRSEFESGLVTLIEGSLKNLSDEEFSVSMSRALKIMLGVKGVLQTELQNRQPMKQPAISKFIRGRTPNGGIINWLLLSHALGVPLWYVVLLAESGIVNDIPIEHTKYKEARSTACMGTHGKHKRKQTKTEKSE